MPDTKPQTDALLSEAGLFIITESGDYLVREQFVRRAGGYRSKGTKGDTGEGELWEVSASLSKINNISLRERFHVKKYIIQESDINVSDASIYSINNDIYGEIENEVTLKDEFTIELEKEIRGLKLEYKNNLSRLERPVLQAMDIGLEIEKLKLEYKDNLSRLEDRLDENLVKLNTKKYILEEKDIKVNESDDVEVTSQPLKLKDD